jgi:sucrose-6-phosphate hydrolase SacC (GH32 family)
MPGYHFRPDRNWINDPFGFTKVGDRYHLFFQYNPLGPEPGIKHWGHAVTQDLVRWEILPMALSPTDGGPDEGECWSGSITTLVEPPISSTRASGMTRGAVGSRWSAWPSATKICDRGKSIPMS